MKKISSRLPGIFLMLLLLSPFARGDDSFEENHDPYPYTELVLAPHAVLTATTETGTMKIKAMDALTREYTWEGDSRSVRLWPREERWYGSLGAYYPGPGEHWKNHNGITRGVLEEGWQNFSSESDALAWLQLGMNHLMVYRDDGLAVDWSKDLDRGQLNVDVWQILIGGKKPMHLPGSQNSKIILNGKEQTIGK